MGTPDDDDSPACDVCGSEVPPERLNRARSLMRDREMNYCSVCYTTGIGYAIQGRSGNDTARMLAQVANLLLDAIATRPTGTGEDAK